MAITIDELQIEIQAKGAESASGIDKLTTSLGALKRMINKSLVGKLESLSSALDGIKAPITVNMNVKGMEQLKKSVQEATANIPANASNITPAVDGSAVASEMNRIKASTEQASSSFETISSEAKRAKQELKSAGDAAGDAGKKLKEVGTSAKHGASGLSKFVSSLKRILMYRVVRSILSNIAKAAREGIQNLVQYSTAIGGIDASRANATMSQFASIGMQVKNTLGSALMPVLNALMPVIQTVANWFITAANAVNQFFAAISGASTWTKAKEYAVDYAAGLNKASGAAKDLKKQLLPFDELNILQDNSTSGGGGAGALDYGDMFEEVPINQNLADLALKIKDNFGWIEGAIAGIAVALLGLKLAGGLKGDITMLLANLKNIAAIVLVVAGAAAITGGAFDAWQNGVDWKNLLAMVGGMGLLVGGLAIKFGAVGAAIGLLIGGIALLVVGVKDWITTGELSNKTFAAMEIGILAVGGALAILISPWALVVAAVAAAALAIYKYWDEISSAARNIVTVVGNFGIEIINSIIRSAENIVNFFINKVNDFIYGVNVIISAINTLLGIHLGGLQLVQTVSFSRINPLGDKSTGKFANGGFPTTGQLFIANEAGPEMVGSMGGRTTVANNDQIVEGIRQGVYDAMIAALSTQKQDGGAVKVYLDGKELSANVAKHQWQNQRATGVA